MTGYLVSILTFTGFFLILALALNLQWGMTGMVNFAIAGFYGLGAYTSGLLTMKAGMPVGFAIAAAPVAGAILGAGVAALAVRLREDFFAIATLGFGETLRLIFLNEDWLTNGVRGIAGVPRPLAGTAVDTPVTYLIIVVLFVVAVYFLVQRAYVSPWGRVLRAVRENEPASAAAGKDIARFRLQAFVVGSAIMGLGGGLYVHYFGFVSPEAFRPLYGTFLIWVMLIAGGSGNNRGAILGAVIVWGIWSGTQMFTGMLPSAYATQAAALRVLLIGVLLQIILVTRPQGLLPEKAPRLIARRGKR